MKEIALTQGKVAIVDDADYEAVSSMKWHVTSFGYARNSGPRNGGKQAYTTMHRMILGMAHGDGRIVDHINGDKLDNRRDNLRIVTAHQSTVNRFRKTRKHTRYKGASPGTRSPNRWYAKITGPDHKAMHLGSFDNPRSAAIAYDFAALFLYGSNAAINGVLSSHRQYAARCLLPEADDARR